MTENEQIKPGATTEYIRLFLQEPPLILKNFHHEDILEYLNCGYLEHYVQDDVILNDGDYVNSAYLVVNGKVGVWQGNIQLAVLNKGSFLGEAFLFSRNMRIAKIISAGDSALLKFERHAILNFFRKKPEKLFNIFTRNIIELQQSKIGNMNDQLFNLKKRLLGENSW